MALWLEHRRDGKMVIGRFVNGSVTIEVDGQPTTFTIEESCQLTRFSSGLTRDSRDWVFRVLPDAP